MLIPPPLTPWDQKSHHLADWTIVVNSQTALQVNSTALACNSKYFHDAFLKKRGDSKSGLLSRDTRINYADLDAVKDVLNFIEKVARTKELLPDADLIDLLRTDRLKSRLTAARHFGIPRLIDSIVCSALQNLTHSNCWEIMSVAADPECACDLLESVVKEYALCHFLEASEKPKFVSHVSYNQLSDLLQSDYLDAPDEFKLFDTICRWVSGDEHTRLRHFPSLLCHMRLGRLSSAQRESIFCSPFVRKTHFQSNKVIKLATCASKMLASKSSKPRDCQSGEDRTMLTRMMQPRLPHQAIFLCGGRESNNGLTGSDVSCTVQVFDPIANEWIRHDTYLPVMSERREGSICLELDNVVYLIGGMVDVPQASCCLHSDKLLAYHLKQNVWRERAPMHQSRAYHCACQCNGRLYSIGGQENDYRYVGLASAEAYHPDEDRWVGIAPMRTGRRDASATSLNGQIYVCGGIVDGGFSRSVEQYNPTANQWTRLASLPVGTDRLSVCTLDNLIFALGGETENNGSDGEDDDSEVVKTVHCFDPATNTWSRAQPMTDRRSSFGACVLYNQLHVIGGRPDLKSVERFGNYGAWEPVASLAFPTESFGCCTIVGCDVIEPLLSRK